MNYFGDVSGHFKGLLHGNCEICVAAIVAGEREDCHRCPKKAVRRIDDIPEAKWRDLLYHDKRRIFECFDNCGSLELGYAAFSQDQLHTLKNYHLLYQDISFPTDWDLVLVGYAYGEILYKMGVDEEINPILKFDRVSSQAQSNSVANHVEHFVPNVDVSHKGSRQCDGIQAADCLAGGIAEDHKKIPAGAII